MALRRRRQHDFEEDNRAVPLSQRHGNHGSTHEILQDISIGKRCGELRLVSDEARTGVVLRTRQWTNSRSLGRRWKFVDVFIKDGFGGLEGRSL